MNQARLYIPPGKRFGLLKVIREGPPVTSSHPPRRTMICSCACGTPEVTVRVDTLSRGHTRSCGCLRKEAGRNASKAAMKHGLRMHPLYGVWLGLRRRAKDRRSADYATGIYEGWLESPAVFIAEVEAEIGLCPAGAVIERVDDELDFGPGNVRWVSHAEHLQRRRSVARLADRISALERENKRLAALVETLRGELEMYQLYSR